MRRPSHTRDRGALLIIDTELPAELPRDLLDAFHVKIRHHQPTGTPRATAPPGSAPR
jgi:hypothetical protein